VLEHAHLERARLLAVLMPDATAAELTTRHARGMSPRLDIVARGAGVADLDRLRNAGATEVVQPEFEAGQEVIRHALRRFGLGGLELSNLITGRRAAFYRRMAEELG
jgi:CPA2 family monovalent cation:H+ antiporter-2